MGAAPLSCKATGPPPGLQAALEVSRFILCPLAVLYPICWLVPHLLGENWVGPDPDASPLLSRADLVTNYPCTLLFLFCFINL